jgi:acyl carrier protein
MIKKELNTIILSFCSDTDTSDIRMLNKALHIIMSESSQAIAFLTIVEDEFDIEIDDDDISLDNFLDYHKLISIIENYQIK